MQQNPYQASLAAPPNKGQRRAWRTCVIRQISLSSFCKLGASVGFAFGCMIGPIYFCVFFFGIDSATQVGIPALLMGLFAAGVAVVVYPITCFALAVLLYWPHNLLLRWMGGIRVTIEERDLPFDVAAEQA